MTKPSTTIFAARLHHARDTRGLTQAQLATRTGINPAVLSHFESDARLPAYHNLGKLATALHVSVDYLMGRTDDPALHGATDPLLSELARLSARDSAIVLGFIHLLRTMSSEQDYNGADMVLHGSS